MHDNILAYKSVVIRQEIEERSIYPIFQLLLSLNLNPIKHVQNKIKYQIKRNYPNLLDRHQYSYNKLQYQVKEAQNTITSKYLKSLVISIRERCQAIIKAEGRYTRF